MKAAFTVSELIITSSVKAVQMLRKYILAMLQDIFSTATMCLNYKLWQCNDKIIFTIFVHTHAGLFFNPNAVQPVGSFYWVIFFLPSAGLPNNSEMVVF